MPLRVEDLEDQSKYRQLLKVPYEELVTFVLDYIRRKSGVMISFWFICVLFLGIALSIRYNISGYFHFKSILLNSILGLIVFPILIIPVHELMHIIPFYLTGVKRIRIGVDLKQYIFYVTAHRHVITRRQYWFVALIPFITINIALLILILFLPGLWKWSLSLLLFVHTTMCAGDFAIMNFFFLNRKKKIFSWDDADEKAAYFYEEI